MSRNMKIVVAAFSTLWITNNYLWRKSYNTAVDQNSVLHAKNTALLRLTYGLASQLHGPVVQEIIKQTATDIEFEHIMKNNL